MPPQPDDLPPSASQSGVRKTAGDPHLRALIAEQAEMIASLQLRLLDNEAQMVAARQALVDRDALLDQLRRADIRHLGDLSRLERLTAEVMVLQAALRAVVSSVSHSTIPAQTVA